MALGRVIIFPSVVVTEMSYVPELSEGVTKIEEFPTMLYVAGDGPTWTDTIVGVLRPTVNPLPSSENVSPELIVRGNADCRVMGRGVGA